MSKRTKKTPKPLFAVKADYDAAVNNVAHEANMLLTTVETLLIYIKEKVGGNTLNNGTRQMLEERTKALRGALHEPLDLG